MYAFLSRNAIVGSLARATGAVIFIRILSISTGFFFTSALSFLIDKANYGAVATVISMATFASAFGEFGQRDLMAREVSRALATSQGGRALRLAEMSTLWAATTGLMSGIAVFALGLFSGLSLPLSIGGGGLTLALCLDGSWSGTGRAFGQMFWAIAPRDIIWRSVTIALIMLLIALGLTVDAVVTVYLLLGCMLFASLLQRLFVRPRMAEFDEMIDHAGPLPKRALLRASRDLAIGYVGGVMLATLDVVVVGLVLGSAAAAEYFPANRVSVLALTLPITFQLVFASKFAEAVALGQMDLVKTQARWGAIISTFGTFVGCVFIFSGGHLFPLLFGTATHTTWIVTIILSAGSLINACFGFGGSVLVAAGHEADLRRITTWSVPITVVALVLAALLWGELGVAWAVSIISSLRLLAVAIASHRRVGFAGTALV